MAHRRIRLPFEIHSVAFPSKLRGYQLAHRIAVMDEQIHLLMTLG
jgi:hypothetical protein